VVCFWWALGLALIIPGMIPHFSTVVQQGLWQLYRRLTGAVVGSFVNGLLITFLPALLLSFMGNLGLANTTFGDSDFCWAGILGGSISRLGTTGAYLGIILVSVVLLAIASIVSVRARKSVA